MKRTIGLLPQVSFAILLALSLKPRHGYEIMRQISTDSLGQINPGAGSLYASLKQLSADGLIEAALQTNHSNRRYYRLTKLGWTKLDRDLIYFSHSLQLTRLRGL
jgi:DNA-binding PadR family transcriptional regulator